MKAPQFFQQHIHEQALIFLLKELTHATTMSNVSLHKDMRCTDSQSGGPYKCKITCTLLPKGDLTQKFTHRIKRILYSAGTSQKCIKPCRELHTCAAGESSSITGFLEKRWQLQDKDFPKTEFKIIYDQRKISGHDRIKHIAFDPMNIKEIPETTYTKVKVIKGSLVNFKALRA